MVRPALQSIHCRLSVEPLNVYGLDVKLQAGIQGQTITITDAPPPPATINATLGTIISNNGQLPGTDHPERHDRRHRQHGRGNYPIYDPISLGSCTAHNGCTPCRYQ